MKSDVHLFCVVRVKCAGIEANSHGDAVRKVIEQFQDLYGLFETRNFRRLPDGVSEVEFGEEITKTLVDDAEAEDFSGSTWHDGDGNPEPFIVEAPLSAREFRGRIGSDGRVQLAIAMSLQELRDCGDIDGFNELVDSRLYGDGVNGCLTDLVYRPLRVKDESVVIEIDAATDELELEEADEPDKESP